MVVTSIDISTPAVIMGAVRFGDVPVVGGTGERDVGRDLWQELFVAVPTRSGPPCGEAERLSTM